MSFSNAGFEETSFNAKCLCTLRAPTPPSFTGYFCPIIYGARKLSGCYHTFATGKVQSFPCIRSINVGSSGSGFEAAQRRK